MYAHFRVGNGRCDGVARVYSVVCRDYGRHFDEPGKRGRALRLNQRAFKELLPAASTRSATKLHC
jgi:hypothetical protein